MCKINWIDREIPRISQFINNRPRISLICNWWKLQKSPKNNPNSSLSTNFQLYWQSKPQPMQSESLKIPKNPQESTPPTTYAEPGPTGSSQNVQKSIINPQILKNPSRIDSTYTYTWTRSYRIVPKLPKIDNQSSHLQKSHKNP